MGITIWKQFADADGLPTWYEGVVLSHRLARGTDMYRVE
jgi:hypothetical protein